MAADTLIEDAAAGRLPAWAAVSRRRMEHCRRVAALMDDWAAALDLPERDRVRWRATAWLHDSVKNATADELRRMIDGPMSALPDALLHGPAAAACLRAEGVADESMLAAITWHTTGSADLDALGHALYIADFVEPGRRYVPAMLATMRARMPHALALVLRDVVSTRLRFLLDAGRPIRPETVIFWNSINPTGGGR